MLRYVSAKPVTVGERRSDDRVPDEIPALFARDLADPDIQAAEVKNLSEGGACASVRTPPAVGAEFYVGFFLQGFGGMPLIARMRVMWTRPDGDMHLVGLSFLADGLAQRDALQRMREYLAARRREILAAAV